MTTFLLKVWRIEQTCLFELIWNQTHTISAKLRYPATLGKLYDQWRVSYLAFYRSHFLAQPGISLSLAEPDVDWRAKLVQAEAAFLAEFHRWLNDVELIEIRRTIARAAAQSSPVELFIRCDAIELTKLPWESWQINAEFGSQPPVRITRTAPLQTEASPPVRRRKARVLAILGDDTGLQTESTQPAFAEEAAALKNLSSILEIQFLGWQPGKNPRELMDEIRRALADEQGWDILFFTGHSNETELTGGEIAIAPNTAILISEIATELSIAQSKGLQFAIFNSCSGVSIAESLIHLGLGQVAVMREPIHHKVARLFLLHFIPCLAQGKNVHEAMLATCQMLKQAQNMALPSAYLLPSLFTHPNAQPLPPLRRHWLARLKAWMPTRLEAIALGSLAVLSSLLPVQSGLIDQRQAVQAAYRQITAQGIAPKTPPVLLIQVDEASLQRDNVEIINQNLDRNYLAQLIRQVSALKAPIVGLDYLLFRHQPRGDRALVQALQSAVNTQGTQFVFATTLEAFQSTPKWVQAIPEIGRWGSHADMDLFGDPVLYARVVGDTTAAVQRLPLAHQLVLAHQQARGNYRRNHRQQRHPISKFAAAIGQMWLHPLIDFSIPPNQIYQSIPAWKIAHLDTPTDREQHAVLLSKIQQQIVLIAPGGQIDAGITPGEDNFISPRAVNYWRRTAASKITGGELHAYQVHNLLNQRLIIPVPDLWMIGVAGLLGKATALWLTRQGRRRSPWFLSLPLVYTAASLQAFIASAVLWPLLFPILVYVLYLAPFLVKRDRHA